MTSYYKVLNEDGSAIYGAGEWAPGEWRSVDGELVPCQRGLHLCRREDLVSWLGPAIWTAEADESEVIAVSDKVVVRRARVLDRIDTWDERTARLFAADCAERVLPSYGAESPSDPRPRQAIEVARRCAEGKATPEDLVAAYRAVTAAADSAAGSAAHWPAPAAAYRAAGSAAYYGSAHWAAGSAAHWAATAAADSVAEREWQTERLFAYLDGGA